MSLESFCNLFLLATLSLPVVDTNPVSESRGSSIGDKCGIKNYDEIKQKLLMYADVFDSLYRLKTFANASAIPTHPRTSCAYNNDSKECKQLKKKNSEGGETCPSVRVENVDHNRVPCVMEELRCQCEQCMFPNDLPDDKNFTCKPIFHYVPVMRTTDKKVNNPTWTQHLEPVVVGCKCEPKEGTNSLQKTKKCKKKASAITTKNTNKTTKKPKKQDKKQNGKGTPRRNVQ